MIHVTIAVLFFAIRRKMAIKKFSHKKRKSETKLNTYVTLPCCTQSIGKCSQMKAMNFLYVSIHPTIMKVSFDPYTTKKCIYEYALAPAFLFETEVATYQTTRVPM